MAEAYTISVSNDDHAEEHSRRSYTPGSADRSLQSQNVVIYDCGDDRKHFNDFFRPAIEAYNAKQTRADRKKSLDYFSALQNGTEGYGRGKAKEKPILVIGLTQQGTRFRCRRKRQGPSGQRSARESSCG